MSEKVHTIVWSGNDTTLRVEEDGLKRRKYFVSVYKGYSLGDPERYLSDKLIMFRFKIHYQGNLADYVDTPIKKAIELIESTDIDLQLVETFFSTKWEKQQVIKYFGALLDVYKVVSPGEKLGELEMDHSTFVDMLKFFKILSYETFKSENVIR